MGMRTITIMVLVPPQPLFLIYLVGLGVPVLGLAVEVDNLIISAVGQHVSVDFFAVLFPRQGRAGGPAQ